jgi:CRISPR-associated protein Cmr2
MSIHLPSKKHIRGYIRIFGRLSLMCLGGGDGKIFGGNSEIARKNRRSHLMEYLFLASIGPVQSFIASARRTRDLWFGSMLLSELAKAAAKKIVDNEQNSLIFPAPNPENKDFLSPGSSLNVANKIVALIHQPPQELGNEVHQAIFARLHKIREDAFQGIKSQIYYEVACKQIDDLVEYFWVAVPFDGTDYENVRRNLEALMAARKNTRDFQQVGWGSKQPKSSIDGQMESVVPEDRYPDRRDSQNIKTGKVNFFYSKYHANARERLSGVDLLKRLGKIGSISNFPRTTHMSTLPFLYRLSSITGSEATEAVRLWKAYTSALQRIADEYRLVLDTESIPGIKAHPILKESEGTLLFEERIADVLGIAGVLDNTIGITPAKDALAAFYRYTDKYFDDGKVRPNTYYAILLADGDRMGEVIEAQAKHDYEAHRNLSRALDTFAGNVGNTVASSEGALVYAGGDDILAFMPLHTVLQCAYKLAKDFSDSLKGFENDKGEKPTLSVGIAIVHHLYSLRDALNLARAGEKKAKSVPGKNALAITLSKHSGADCTVAGKWDDLDKHLEQLIKCYRSDGIPHGTAYELRDLALRLMGSTLTNSVDHQADFQKMIQAESKRILERKMAQSGKEEVEKILKSRLGIEREEVDDPKNKTVDIEEFTNELIIAQFLAEARELAKLPEESNS